MNSNKLPITSLTFIEILLTYMGVYKSHSGIRRTSKISKKVFEKKLEKHSPR